MKKRLEKIASLLISVILIVSSMPIGILAEEVSQPTSAAIVNNESTIEDNLQLTEVKTEVTVPADTNPSAVAEPTLVTQNVSQSMDTSGSVTAAETMETMAGYEPFTCTEEDQLLTITGYDISYGSDVKIPEMLGGKKVVAIGANAFANLAIKTVTLNYNIQSIGDGAFANCAALTTVEIPGSVTDIGAAIVKDSPNATINCVSKSWAEEYAKENNIPYLIISLPVISGFTASKASGQNINTEIPLTATVTGGTAPYTYYFYYDCMTATPTTAVIPSTDNKATFKPIQKGIYNLYVKVTDKSGKYAIKSIDDFQVTNQPVFKDPGFTANLASPQYKDTSIELTASVEGGTGLLSYEFFYDKGSATGTIPVKSATETNKAIFTSPETGTYTLRVVVSDSEGNKAEKSIANYIVVDQLSIASFTSDNQSNKLEVNTKVKLTAQGAGGKSGYQYRFYYTLDSAPTVEKTIQAYSTINTATFQPTVTGDYNVYVQIKNASGAVGIITDQPFEYKVVTTPAMGEFKSAVESGKLYVNDETVLTATATGGTGTLTYAFAYKLENDKTAVEKTITPVVGNTAKFVPVTAGSYSLYVDVKDADGNTNRKTISGFKVLDEFKAKLTPDKTSPQNRDAKIKLTATGTGGKPAYTYQFSYRLSTELIDKAILLAAYSTNSTAEFVPPTAETYTLSVDIKDANGIKIAHDEINYTFRNSPIVKELKTNRDTEVYHYVGDEIQFTPTVEAGTGTGTCTYEYYYKLGTAKAVLITDATGKATDKFTPPKIGAYTFSVIAKDSAGLTSNEKIITNYQVLTAVDGQALKVDKLSPQNTGTIIKLSTSGTGGKAPYTYRFYCKSENGTDKGEIQAYSVNKTAEYDLSKVGVGTYVFYVDIKDAGGVKIATKFTDKFKVVNTPDITFTATPGIDKGQYVNEAINLKAEIAKGTGNGTLSYKFYSKLGSGLEEEILNPTIVVGDATTKASATVNFTPKAAGTYTFYVEVTDSDGKTKKIINTYKVMNKIDGTLKTNVKSGTNINVGKNITLTATATGGKTPYLYKYSYTVKNDLGNVIKTEVIQDYSTAKTVNFIKPDAVVGLYAFSVEIVDANDNSKTKAVVVTAETVKVVNAPVVTLTSEKASGKLYAGETTILTAKVKDGTGTATSTTPLNYRFYYKQGSTQIDIPIKAKASDGRSATAEFTPSLAGNYNLYVEVTDQDVTTTQPIASYKVLKGFSVLLKTNVKPGTNVNIGKSIALTATGAGGQTPYQYEYTVKAVDEDDKEIVSVNETFKYSTAKIMNYTPKVVGTYTFTVKMVDANDSSKANPVVAMAETVKVVNAPVVTLTSEKASGKLYAGETTILTAKVKEGTGTTTSTIPLTYRFYYKQGNMEIDIPTKAASGNTATAEFTPTVKGIYNLFVEVTDKDVTTPQTIKSYSVLALLNATKITVIGKKVGTPVNLTATGIGGQTPYTYKFTVNGGGVTKEFPESISKTVTFTPTTAGSCTFTVVITDVNKKTSTYTLSNYEISK